MSKSAFKKIGRLGLVIVLPLLALVGLAVYAADQAEAQEPLPLEAFNLVANGNFEFGFYQVYELGFEPPNVGNVPIDWRWYKNQAYGKYNIYNNEGFGIVCPDDQFRPPQPRPEEDSPFGPVPGVAGGPPPNNSVSLHMQSTDQQDARLGIFQVIDVVPGQDYRFSISATIQVQKGADTLQSDDPDDPIQAPNHTYELYFDHTGGRDWRAIPHERRTILPIAEQDLEFKVSGPDDPDLAEIQDYETIVTARSDKMTIFITGWRKWANWRSAIFTFDCVSLIPVSRAGIPASALPAEAEVAPAPAEPAAEADPNGVQEAAFTEPAAAEDAEAQTAPAETTQIIPPSGGVLDQSGRGLFTAIASILAIGGLLSAGIWNIRRRG